MSLIPKLGIHVETCHGKPLQTVLNNPGTNIKIIGHIHNDNS